MPSCLAAGVRGVERLGRAHGVAGFGDGEGVFDRDFGRNPDGEEAADHASGAGAGKIEVAGGVRGEEVDAGWIGGGTEVLADFVDGVVVAVEDGDQTSLLDCHNAL